MSSSIAFSSSSSSSSSSSTLTKSFGVSQSISHARPSSHDIASDLKLRQTLKSLKSFESEQEARKRVQVLSELNTLVKKWVIELTGQSLGAKALPFGSFRLNVHSPGSDIDVLIVVPWAVSRAHFFSTFVRMLSGNDKVTELNAVPTAFVPIITLKFDGVELDLLFARLAVPEINATVDLLDDQILKNLDEQSVRSINGYRVGERLLDLVPDFEVFGVALRTIKIWAKSVGVYSNAMGYLGGISWAILVARTCQLYPTATASKIVEKVFFVFSTWNWSSPVLLEHVKRDAEMHHLNKLVWMPRYEKMTILTPVFPSQNSCYNVSESTATVIGRELKEAHSMCQQVNEGHLEWKDLLGKVNFFTRHMQFLAVVAASPSPKFTGLIESKLRKLVENLERNPMVSLAHLDVKSYEVKKSAKTDNKVAWFVGLELAQNAKHLDLSREINSFRRLVKPDQGDVELDFHSLKRSELIKLLPAKVLKDGRYVKKSSGSSTSTSSSTSPPQCSASGNVLKRKNTNLSETVKRVKL